MKAGNVSGSFCCIITFGFLVATAFTTAGALPSDKITDSLLFCLYSGLEREAELWLPLIDKREIDKRDLNGDSALNLASKRRFPRCVNELLTKGANPNLGNTNGQTPLFWAALSGDTNLATRLLAAGARADTKTIYGWTPLMVSQVRGYTSASSLLAEKRITSLPVRFKLASKVVAVAREGKSEELKRLLSEGADPNTADDTGVFPLEAAIVGKQNVSVRELIRAGADPRQRFLFGREALSLAKENGFEAAIPLLRPH